MELRLPLEMSPGREAACRAVFGTWGFSQEMQVQSLDREDFLEKEMATHSSILAWEIPGMEVPGGLQFVGLQKSQTRLSD